MWPARRVLVLLVTIVTLLLGVQTAATDEASLDERPLISHEGQFELRQSDNAATCSYSGAPLTNGDMALSVDWDNLTGAIFMTGQGSGTRRNLQCGDYEASFTWSSSYTIDAAGFLNYGFGKFELSGTLDGTGSTVYFDCTDNGAPADCPPNTSGPYSFPVMLRGSFDCSSDESFGTIQVENIGLPTSGGWSSHLVSGEGFAHLKSEQGHIELNGRPVPVGCAVPTVPSDEFTINGQSEALYLLCRDWRWMTLGFVELEATARILLDLCTSDEQRAGEPGLVIEIDQGAVSAITERAEAAFQINTAQLSAGSGGPGNLYLSNDGGTGASVVRVMQGSATVVPAGTTESTAVGAWQQLAVTNGVAGPVIDLELLSLPFVTNVP